MTIPGYGGLPVIETDHLPGVHPALLGRDPTTGSEILFVRRTRPSLHFPLTEALAMSAGIDLWYFDPVKWPDRIAEPLLDRLRAP